MAHLVYPHACFAKRKKQAELNHLLLDAFLLGSWTAAIHFDVGLGFALLSAVSLNNTKVGGLPRLAKALGMFAAGMLMVGALNDVEFLPSASLTITVLGLLGVLIYMIIVALLFHQQNLRMLATMKENVENGSCSNRLPPRALHRRIPNRWRTCSTPSICSRSSTPP